MEFEKLKIFFLILPLISCALKSTLKTFDASQYGGAPLLGLNGLVVKTHGSAKAKEVTNSIYQCVTFKEQDINGKIKKNILGSAEQEGM
jgi:glycerol-3-phosphate acyltransferase PlsX